MAETTPCIVRLLFMSVLPFAALIEALIKYNFVIAILKHIFEGVILNSVFRNEFFRE